MREALPNIENNLNALNEELEEHNQQITNNVADGQWKQKEY